MDPPTSSSLAEGKRLCSLLLSTAGARFPTLAACFVFRASGRQAFGRFPWFALFFLRARRLRALLAISASQF
jgi:hypothetical protein